MLNLTSESAYPHAYICIDTHRHAHTNDTQHSTYADTHEHTYARTYGYTNDINIPLSAAIDQSVKPVTGRSRLVSEGVRLRWPAILVIWRGQTKTVTGWEGI